MNGPSMLALVGDMSGPTLWRVLQPFTMLQQRGWPGGWDFKDARGIGDIAPLFDGFVLPRMAWAPGARRLAETWFAAVKRAGKVVVYDADDDLFTAALDRRAVELDWTDGKSAAELAAERHERIWTLQQCDGVTVSTQRLATVVRTLTDRPVVVVPNAIDVDWFRRVSRVPTRETRGLTIGWAGGRRPDRDVELMARAWGRLAVRYADLTFVVAGHVPPVIVEQVPPERLVQLPWRSLEHYPESYAEIDIACCSVSDEPFNRCKSPIKAYEAAVAGAVVVASPSVYGGTIEHGRNGYIASSADEWERYLGELVESPRRRRMLALRLLRAVERKYSLAENLHRWPSAWAAIAEDARVRRGKLVLA
jgi:glycosyltransferase involved in cell wall biosynthesis